MTKPYGSILEKGIASLVGRILVNTLPPSNGGMGSIFNAISTRLICIPATPILNQKSVLDTPILYSRLTDIAHSIAMNRFEAGPARATQAISRLGFLSIRQSTGTGLAQPNNRPAPPISLLLNNKNNGTATVPTGSICLIGLRLTLPAAHAV